MGCCISRPNQKQTVDPSFIDIPLLKPQQSTGDFGAISYYTMEEPKRKSSYEGDIIEHTALSIIAAPDIEQARKQTFNECFSHIEVNTFQNIPLMSVQSHLSLPQIDALAQQSQHPFEDYTRFLDQVLSTIVKPLENMKVQSNVNLTVMLD